MKRFMIAIVIIVVFCITGCTLNANFDWFSKNSFEIISDLEGYRFDYVNETVNEQQKIDLTKDSLQFENWELLTKDSKLISFMLADLNSYGSDIDKEISYVDFSEKCSKNLYYKPISDYWVSVLLDYDTNTLYILKNLHDHKEVLKAVKFDDKYSLKDLTCVGGFCENDEYVVGFLTKDNSLYIININTLEILNKQKMGNLQYISDYVDIDYPSKKQHLYTYFVNKDTNELVKMDLSDNKELYTRKLNENIEGEIELIEPDLNVLFILSKVEDGYNIYSLREEDNCLLAVKTEDDEANRFTNIDNLIYYIHTMRDLKLIVYNSESENPFTILDAYGIEWIHVD